MPRTRPLSRKKVYYIYILLDPTKPGPFFYGHWKFDYEPFYVGKGCGKRRENHFYLANKDKVDGNLHKFNKIKKIQRVTGSDPIILTKRFKLTERQAIDLETYLIPKIGRANLKLGPLTNLTDGGEGPSGYKYTKAQSKKMSEIRRGKTALNKGIPMSDKQKADIAATLTGRKQTKSHKLNAANARARNRKLRLKGK